VRIIILRWRLQAVGWDVFDRIYVAKDRIKCQVFLNTLIYGLVDQLVASLRDF
jgi:hypothetical protein